MHPDDLPKVREILRQTLEQHLIAINASKLTKEDKAIILDFPLGMLIEKDSGFIVNGIESFINDELRSKGLKLKRYSVYALAAGDFSFEGFKKLHDITESIVGEDPTKKDVVTVRNAIDALLSTCIVQIGEAA